MLQLPCSPVLCFYTLLARPWRWRGVNNFITVITTFVVVFHTQVRLLFGALFWRFWWSPFVDFETHSKFLSIAQCSSEWIHIHHWYPKLEHLLFFFSFITLLIVFWSNDVLEERGSKWSKRSEISSRICLDVFSHLWQWRWLDSSEYFLLWFHGYSASVTCSPMVWVFPREAHHTQVSKALLSPGPLELA